jgi:hypothetical protein
MYRHLIICASLLALAAVTRFQITPRLLMLPADYSNDLRYDGAIRYRDEPDDPWQDAVVTALRRDAALSTINQVGLIESSLYWTSDTDEVLFQANGLFGVDRLTRANIPGYGNQDRIGQFLFPPHTVQTAYEHWDVFYIGPRTATFRETAEIDGLRVYVFHFTARHLDETEGYRHLPDVPERYQVHTDGEGDIWVEPVSGIIVDYRDNGVSYLTDPRTGEQLGSIFQWHSRYTDQTRTTQHAQAHRHRRARILLEQWLPFGFVSLGIGCLVLAGMRFRRS